ncbi:hypothetical protein SAMN05428967_2257 [Phyllobacterium sp. YR620]|uniref:hypothetical protein n=1 Tax=Phyllobacterium sp. YR620 TaxID=1881066 RepID=UPI0008919060|nr:hypothetical protein [Phyllobacterium sp. YR620]SDP46894.1 hypothetical protein SAMN05428967_2257 [Phyllobacterium sp. YR620]
MRKSQIVEILARRLNILPSRVHHIAVRLADDGQIPKAAGSRRFPPELDEVEITRLVLATLADHGLGNVHSSVEAFSHLTSHNGLSFGDVLAEVLFGPPVDVGHVILRHDPPGVSLTINGCHHVYGTDAPVKTAAKASIVPGYALMAIAAELQGQAPSQADAMIELARLQRAFQ